jgi:hypothetical protein
VSSPSNPQNDLGKFPISVTNITLGLNNNKVTLGADVAFNITESGGNAFSVATGIKVISNITDNGGSPSFTFDRVKVDMIALEIQTNPFYLKGSIAFHDQDPVYGKGFYGSLALAIPAVFDDTMSMSCAFGKVDGYRYWFVDASIPVNIPVGYVTLTSIRGGMSNRMKGSKTAQQLIAEIEAGGSMNGNSQTYIPDNTMGLAFRAGVGLKFSANERMFNGDVMFEVAFNANGGLSSILFIGDGYCLVERAKRATADNYVHGTVSIWYDNDNKIFDANINAEAKFYGVITGNLPTQLYFSPGEWFVTVGKPSARGYINVANLASADAYFMMGQNLEPMPPPPANVTAIFNSAGLASQRDGGTIATGDGVATGMSLNLSFSKSIGFGPEDKYSIYGSGAAGVGFDMTAYNYGPTAHCAGSSDQIGLNGWYLQGQLYAYFSLNCGITGRAFGSDFDINLLSASAALLLQGKLPKPTYVYGAVALNATVLGFINVNVGFDFDFGTNCSIVQ